jgi:thiopurine S-methyltransferase
MDNEKYWTERYISTKTGWDIGYPSTPIKEYVDQLSDKDVKILIPGAGNSYEAEYLHNNGFNNVYVLDISKIPLENLIQRVPTFPMDHLIHDDFYSHQQQYDLILEQTFFCALPPSHRETYVTHVHKLLKPQSKLVGVLFGREFSKEGPPYGGTLSEYQALFEPKFEIQIMEECYNSIEPRMGSELFIKLKKI